MRTRLTSRLVERLNGLISDARYHVTSESLPVEGNDSSRGMDVYVDETCRELASVEYLYQTRGAKIIPPSVAAVFWRGGSLSLPDPPKVAPSENLTGQGAADRRRGWGLLRARRDRRPGM